jgi:hypothetical protein
MKYRFDRHSDPQKSMSKNESVSEPQVLLFWF